MPPKRAKVMPGTSAAGTDQSSDHQLKLLQLQLWKNVHLLTGSRARKPTPSMATLSQLTVSVNLDGTPLPPHSDVKALNSLFDEFIAKGGPSSLSKYLLTQERAEDADEDMGGILTPSTTSSTKRSNPTPGSAVPLNSLPIHSIAALNILLGIPSFAQIILLDRRTAMMLIRLARSVSSDDDGGGTLDWTDAALLGTLPFEFFQRLLDAHPLDSKEGAELRQQAVDKGALQLILGCLAIFTQQVNGATVTMKPFGLQLVVGSLSGPSAVGTAAKPATTKQKGWAKGTGYGSGATSGAQIWDADGAKQRQRELEELAVCLLRTLASFVNPSTPPASLSNPNLLPAEVKELIQSSHLASAICSYLRNDSMMYVSEHVPMFKAILHLLRALAACPKVSSILVPPPGDGSTASTGSQSIYWLLRKFRNYVPRNMSMTAAGAQVNDPDGELAELSEDLILTFTVVKTVVISDYHPSWAIKTPESTLTSDKLYCDTMKPLKFESYDILVESDETGGASASNPRFTVAFHFEKDVKVSGNRSDTNRMRRLAQEVATLKTSLPVTASSSVFVRCDTDRLDIMKVLITGPADTPYSNGCFEFDVYFPADYPNAPMKVNLATTGRQTIRFNPNLYNTGKVCLSVLNTWQGRPEEMWNKDTSTFLQVLISIQSLILIAQPYFNEPGYEGSLGTPAGNKASRDYNAAIRQATVNWAMLDQLKNPSACFKEVIEKHFYLKRKEVEKQCEDWIADMEKDQAESKAVSKGLIELKKHYELLKVELARLTPPAVSSATTSTSCDGDGFEDLAGGMPMELADYGEPYDDFIYDDSSVGDDEDEDDEDDVYEDAMDE